MKFFKKPTALAVLALIVLWLFFIQRSEAETIVEVAPAVLYGGGYEKHFSLMYHERIAGKYDFGVVLLLDADDENGNRGFEVIRTAQLGDWEAGIGYTFWANEQSQAWNTDNTFTLVVGWERDRWGVRWRHWSTAGTSSRNRGMDMLTVGYSFGRE